MREGVRVNWYEQGGIYGPDYMSIFPAEAESGASEADRAIRLLGLSGGEVVLDVGCGYGRHAINLASRRVRVVGLDINEYFLRLAHEGSERHRDLVSLVRGDMRSLPFASGNGGDGFDAAVCLGGSFGQFASEDEDLSLLQETARVLRPGGKFLLDVANRDGILSRFVGRDWNETGDGTVVLHERRWDSLKGRLEGRDLVLGNDGRRREYEHSMRLYGAPEIESLFRRAGLDVLALYGNLAGSAFGWDSPRVNLVAQRPR